jgi:hypothetical protein
MPSLGYQPKAFVIPGNKEPCRISRISPAPSSTTYQNVYSCATGKNLRTPNSCCPYNTGRRKVDLSHRTYRFSLTEIGCSAKTTCRKHGGAQKNRYPFPYTNQLEKVTGAGTSSLSDKTTGQTSGACCWPENFYDDRCPNCSTVASAPGAN